MRSLTKNFSHPIFIFLGGMLLFSLIRISTGNQLREVIRSDGRGYYAYLPALFIFSDNQFTTSAAKEKSYYPDAADQLYLHKNKEGNYYDKYFPGIAVMQLPFFGMACLFSYLAGLPVDGYSNIFSFFYFLGYLFYAIAGVYLFYRLFTSRYPQHKKTIGYLLPLFYLSTTMLFYGFHTPSLSHGYSVFLFAAFGLLILRLQTNISFRLLLGLGALVGLIFLVRPSNLLVLTIIPFLLGNLVTTRELSKKLFFKEFKKGLLVPIGFILVASVLFLLWKWQTGKWIVWSYNGEGFNLLQPHFLDGLFSFRNGLFLHAPIVILILFGVFFLWKKSRFQSTWWLVYFVINFWVISSWWCWDYDSPFGNRPLTEHFVFLLLPLGEWLHEHRKKIFFVGLFFTSIVGGLRYYAITSGFMPDQRFTSSNYVESLAVWKHDNSNRWQFTESTPPFGKESIQLNLLRMKESQSINGEEYAFTSSIQLPAVSTDRRLYYRVALSKKHTNPLFDGVFLVIDGNSKDKKKRFYSCIPLYNDRKDGDGTWHTILFTGQVYDPFNECDEVSFYLWNQSHKQFEIKDLSFELGIYTD